jgi:hypothetical protein
VPHAGAWRTKRRIFTTNYEPKSPVRHASDRSDEKTVIVRGALNDITAIYDEIVSVSRMWFYFIDYLKVDTLNEGNRDLIDKEYRRLCDQPRIVKALAILRQKSTRQAQR